MPDIDKKGSVITSTDIENAKGLKVLVSRGKNDELTGTKQYNSQKRFFEKNGYQILSFEYEGGHYLTEKLLDKVFDWVEMD